MATEARRFLFMEHATYDKLDLDISQTKAVVSGYGKNHPYGTYSPFILCMHFQVT